MALVPASVSALAYQVVPGDNLSKIAEDHGTNWQELYRQNPDIADPNLIFPGQTININEEAQPASAVQATAPVVQATPAPVDTPVQCGDNQYANYIYTHESSCKTHNPNSNGCDGIGQACPGSKVTDKCGYDYDCQNAWFTDYANKRYGGWEGAYNFWLEHCWW